LIAPCRRRSGVDFAPPAARARSQQQSGTRHIGILTNRAENDVTMPKYLGAAEQALTLGWIENQNMGIDLRGANPAELAAQAPTRYETVVNLKTAKTFGLAVPPTCWCAPTR